jgi:hypothetical protein
MVCLLTPAAAAAAACYSPFCSAQARAALVLRGDVLL